MTVRIMYLIALERVFDNAIFDNQVKKLLLKIKGDHGRDLELTLLVLLPWIELTRRGIYSNFWRYKNELKSLQRELSDKSIRLILVRTPFPSAFFQMKLLGLVWFSLIAMPIVWYWIFVKEVQVIHCRYYYATLAALLARRLFQRQIKVIFDVRTLLPELGVEDGAWMKDSMAFRFWKRIEDWMMRHADKVISVSLGMTAWIRERYPGANVEMLPNFVDLDEFYPHNIIRRVKRVELGLGGKTVLVYSGTIGNRHSPVRMVQCVQAFFKIFGEDSFFLILTTTDRKRLQPLINKLKACRFEEGKEWRTLNVSPYEMPDYLNVADLSLMTFAEIPTSETLLPVKFAEYLAVGLPVLTHLYDTGTTRTVNHYGVGMGLDVYTAPEEIKKTLQENKNQMRKRCLEVAKKEFSLERFAQRYYEIYKELVA